MSACHLSACTPTHTLSHGVPATHYILVSEVEAWPDLIGMVTGCLACVEEPLQLKDVEERMVHRVHLLQAPSGANGGP